MKLAVSLIGILSLQYPLVGHADNGQVGLSILCDDHSQVFELNLFELWNEDLNAYLVANPSGVLKKARRLTNVFPDHRNIELSKSCRLRGRTIDVLIHNGLLTVVSNQDLIAKREAYWWWVDLERVYGIRWTKKDGWQECTGVSVGIGVRDYECKSAELPLVFKFGDIERLAKSCKANARKMDW